jgi:phosphatidylglycerol---prolipoprotein diacylglyceryl transferase
MQHLSYLIWSADPELFSLGTLSVRWYGLMFATGFLVSQQIILHIFKKEGKPERDVETLTIVMVVATIIGARLGHVFFYEPARYLSNPVSILKIWEGGLASHGAAFGIILALFLYSNYLIKIGTKGFSFRKRKREGQSFLWVIDRIVIVVAFTGCLIRIGNFFNSEIIGKPTGSDYGVVFSRDISRIIESSNNAITGVEVNKARTGGSEQLAEEGIYPVTVNIQFKDLNYQEADLRAFIETNIPTLLTYRSVSKHIEFNQGKELEYSLNQTRQGYQASVKTLAIVRHPAQLYESGTTLLLFFLLFFIWRRYRDNTPEGLLFGLFLVILFSLRFVHEFFKENQVSFESDIPLNMGQWLSIPLILTGVLVLIRVMRKQKTTA